VDRLGSGVWVSVNLQIFAEGNVLGGDGNCPAGQISGGICPREKCPGEMS